MKTRLDDILHRRNEITISLSDPDITSDQKRYSQLNREYSEIEPVAEQAEKHLQLLQQLHDNQELISDPECDRELR
jgi:peptide chain release factor 1